MDSMITTTLLTLFSFFSLFFILIGIYMKSPVITIAGAVTFLFTGLATITGGVQEFDGTKNSTTTIEYLDSTNTSVSNITLTTSPNYSVRNDYTVTAWSLFMIVSGLSTLVYGATIPGSPK